MNLPEGFTVHPRLKPQIDRRAQMATAGNVDWATGELFAFGALLADGRNVRLAGQDSRRGTFAQRHAVLIDRAHRRGVHAAAQLRRRRPGSSASTTRCCRSTPRWASSTATPWSTTNSLVCWEAQFGDFVGGAQSIIDEYISAGEAKWGQRSSVALLLPHGYEGQGPDHSSARIERFLQLCGEKNMTVAQCTTPANWFHLLRRQGLTERAPPARRVHAEVAAAAQGRDLAGRGLHHGRVLAGARRRPAGDDSAVTRVVLCSGKIAYDLLAARAAQDATGTIAVVRLEQLYPVPVEELRTTLGRFPDAELVWAQEEPANQGPWPFVALVDRAAPGPHHPARLAQGVGVPRRRLRERPRRPAARGRHRRPHLRRRARRLRSRVRRTSRTAGPWRRPATRPVRRR